MQVRKGEEFTIKESRFIKGIVAGEGGADAVEKAGYKVGSRTNAWSMSKEMVRKPRIQQAIQKALQKAGLTPDTIVDALKENIVTGSGTDAKASDANRAIEIWAKLTGAFNNPLTEETYKVTLSKLPTKELTMELEKRVSTANTLIKDIS